MRVLLADDHGIVRRGLRSLLEDADVSVVGEAADGLEAVRLCETLRPDTLIVDPLTVHGRHAQQPFVGRDRVIEVCDRDADVVDVGQLDHRAAPATGCIFAISSRAAATW